MRECARKTVGFLRTIRSALRGVFLPLQGGADFFLRRGFRRERLFPLTFVCAPVMRHRHAPKSNLRLLSALETDFGLEEV